MAELITALMVTGKDAYHYMLAQRSVESFLEQGYPNKKLVVINDGGYSLAEKYPGQLSEIRLTDKKLLGELRNIALEQVEPDALWVQWDDDDWHHPQLMEEQYAALQEHQADGCLLRRQIQYSTLKDAAWVREFDGIQGTIMCRKKPIDYPAVSRREDTLFLQEYRKSHQVVVWDNPAHYYLRFIHGHNTWEDAHFKLDQRETGSWQLGSKGKDYLKLILKRYNF